MFTPQPIKDEYGFELMDRISSKDAIRKYVDGNPYRPENVLLIGNTKVRLGTILSLVDTVFETSSNEDEDGDIAKFIGKLVEKFVYTSSVDELMRFLASELNEFWVQYDECNYSRMYYIRTSVTYLMLLKYLIAVTNTTEYDELVRSYNKDLIAEIKEGIEDYYNVR
jgi:hypothetical protein